MSDDTYMGGEIVITPPVPAATLKAADATGKEVFLRADPGRHVTLILPAKDYTHHPENIVGHVNEIITLVADDHAFTGELYCEGQRHDDIWRVRVVDGTAVAEHAEVVYPADFAALAGEVRARVRQTRNQVRQLHNQVGQTRQDVAWLRRAVGALLDHHQISLTHAGEDPGLYGEGGPV